MAKFEIHFELFQAPTNAEAVNNLGATLTQKFGSKGFELVSVTALPNNALVIGLQRPFPEDKPLDDA